VIVERSRGPLDARDEVKLGRTEIDQDEFGTALSANGGKRITVRLDFETPLAKQHFDHWLMDMCRHHPDAPDQGAIECAPKETRTQLKQERAAVSKNQSLGTIAAYSAKEAVGLFHDAASLEAAVDALEIVGFDRASISVLASNASARKQIDEFYGNIRALEDSEKAPRGSFVSRDARIEAEAAAVGAPLYVGGLAGAWAVAAAGGALALSIAAVIAGGAVGAGLGALLAYAISRRHSAAIEAQLKKGGLLLWVSVPNAEAKKRAVGALTKSGAKDVHIHEVQREWTLKDIPLTNSQPDRWLGREL
jgi:hypothetical protein